MAPATFGGLERVVWALAVGQRSAGHKVSVVAIVEPGQEDVPLGGALRDAGVPVEILEVPRRGYLRERAQFAAICRETRPDIVHCHGYRPDVVDAPVARRHAIAVVATVHGFTSGGWKNRLFEYLDRRALRSMDAVVAVSQAQAAQLRAAGIRPDRLEHVPNAWIANSRPLARALARQALNAPATGRLIGWVGRISAEKGPDVMVEAMARLGHPWIAAFVGDGPQRIDLEARARALGVHSNLMWPGFVPDAGRLYHAFDVFVLSSRTEGIPIVLFEAMAADVPIVATRVGGVPEVVGEGEALLVPSDDPAALAAAIDQIGADPQGAAQRARAARERLTSRFDGAAWIQRYIEVYRQAIARRHAGRG